MQTSPSITAIAKALAEFQREAKNPTNSAKAKVPTKSGGEFTYTYAPLPDVITHVRPLMAKHGLAVVQSPISDQSGVGVTTLLTHTSGEWIMSDPLILPLQAGTAQAAGSAVTYARRYALSAILGISSEDDDDAGLATRETRQVERAQVAATRDVALSGGVAQSAQQGTQQAVFTSAAPKPQVRNPDEPASEAQRKKLYAISKTLNLDRQYMLDMLAEYHAEDSRQLTKGQATELISRLEAQEKQFASLGKEVATDV